MKPKPQTVLRTAFVVAAAGVFVLALLPAPAGLKMFDWQDKLEHGLLFLGLGVLGLLAWPRHPLRVACGLLLYGIAMELAQGQTGYRYGDPFDWIADAVGVALALIVLALWRRRR